ncbi:hypothetical protein [Streptomyces sp. NBC_00878]|uniref:hypothetical protein n=1 Tax=Streptomyces sp. NBC_00878 TaxID=2975854 RepID=UPI00225B5753|nr:hypothetical protein [Streptomyces sp. NBC_00878]MCX4911827.1 hypothetical protein [Streptomyces sp. NBC_00878]
MIENPTPGGDRPSDDTNLPLVDLLSAFLELSDDTENAGRLMLLSSTGQFVGDASLSARDIQIAIKALAAAKAFTDATRDIDIPGQTRVDAYLEADLEEHCLGLDADLLMEMAAQDPNEAVAAFDEITRQPDEGGQS